MLADFRADHIEILTATFQGLHGIAELRDSARSARIKNGGTIIEKLRRAGTRLQRMQDMAGIRVVVSGGRKSQEEAVEAIVAQGLLKDSSCDRLELADQIDEAEGAEDIDALQRCDEGIGTISQVLRSLGDGRKEVLPPTPHDLEHWFLAKYDRVAGRALDWQVGTAVELRASWDSWEAEAGTDHNIEIVALASESLQDLRETHERYFTSMPGVTNP